MLCRLNDLTTNFLELVTQKSGVQTFSRNCCWGNSLEVQRLGLLASTAASTNSIPGWGMQHSQKRKKERKQLHQKTLEGGRVPVEVIAGSRQCLHRWKSNEQKQKTFLRSIQLSWTKWFWCVWLVSTLTTHNFLPIIAQPENYLLSSICLCSTPQGDLWDQ